MTDDICIRPSLTLFAVGLAICTYALLIGDSFAGSLPIREPYPELAIQNGYFVSHEEVVKRGGVGNHVFRPSGQEAKRIQLYREVGEFSTFHRDADGALEIRLDRNALFRPNESDLSPSAKRKLNKLSELMALEGVQSPAIYTRAEVDGRATVIQRYLDERLISAELSTAELSDSPESERRSRKTEVILDEE